MYVWFFSVSFTASLAHFQSESVHLARSKRSNTYKRLILVLQCSDCAFLTFVAGPQKMLFVSAFMRAGRTSTVCFRFGHQQPVPALDAPPLFFLSRRAIKLFDQSVQLTVYHLAQEYIAV